MPETKLVRVADLRLDEENARLGQPVNGQPAAQQTLARSLGAQLVALADDIVNRGLDPTSLLAVVAVGPGSYKVLEGNRRTLALKALETPAIIEGVLQPSNQRALDALSRRYANNPVHQVPCVLFEDEEDAWHWIELRHTSGQGGAGLVRWDANEADRFRARTSGRTRDAAGQVIDLLEKLDGARDSRGIISTLRRVLNNRTAREAFGLVKDGDDLKTPWVQGVGATLSASVVAGVA